MAIRELDDPTIRQIAAGEVIDRPASVVKELVENSLDANATTIDVTIDAGGTDRIQVADNGHGMTRTDAKLAVQQHTTSKITDSTDLTTVDTLGFRGEALYAITTVSKTTLSTKLADAEQGTQLVVNHGSVESIEPVGRSSGTTVTVTDLFGEMPARREFLKTETTEFEHVNRIVSKYALANPDVAVSLTHDDRELFATSGQDDLRAALRAVYGREIATTMLPIEENQVRGSVSHPDTNRSTRNYLATIVNGRVVQSRVLREAILEAYGSQLPSDRYPFAVVFVTVPTDEVDVNIHPRKLQVRFTQPDEVQQMVRDAVEAALQDDEILKAAPTTDTEPPRNGSGGATANPPRPSEAASDDQKRPDDHDSIGASVHQDISPGSIHEPPDASGGEGARTGQQETLTGQPATQTETHESFPNLRILGQLHDTYIVAEADDGLVLVDQHAADERIHYERLKPQPESKPQIQALTDPVEVAVTPGEIARFEASINALTDVGFQIERVDDTILRIHGVPAVIADGLTASRIQAVVTTCLQHEVDPARPIEHLTDDIVGDLACHPAITGSTSLTQGSLLQLLEALDACSNPFACPHGRPVFIQIDTGELRERFERDYPGHGGRRDE